MSFASDLSNMPVIDDTNFSEFEDGLASDGGAFGKGWEPRPEEDPEGFAAPFPFPLIPRSEWKDRIEQGAKTKSFLSHVGDRAGLKMKNQARTNYCWINAPTKAVEYVRAAMGQPYVELSPASVGAPLTNYANANGDPAGVGGWGTKGLKYIAQHGLCPVSMWPSNAIAKKYDTNASRAERAKYRVTEWWDLKAGSLDMVMTCLFLRVPVPVGLGWWRHLVLAVEPVVNAAGQFGYVIDNSWANWGNKGRGVLIGSKAIPNDACAPRVAVAS
jgi:hypothetical protein